jgi:hypothetical protein
MHHFAYILAKMNTLQFIVAANFFNNTLSTCGRLQTKRILRTSDLTKANFERLYTVAWRIG